MHSPSKGSCDRVIDSVESNLHTKPKVSTILVFIHSLRILRGIILADM